MPLPISMSEYLHTSYQPDCDYVDGILERRNGKGPDGTKLQPALLAYINQHGSQWGVRAAADIRVQTSASHVRVADIAILPVGDQHDRVVDSPPVAVIEMLSPEDHIPRHVDRLDNFRRMGIKSIWAVDPAARKGFDASSEEWIETTSFVVPESAIQINLAAVFDAADQDRAL